MRRILALISFLLIVLSAIPIYHMGREIITEQQITSQYEIEHSYFKQGFPTVIDTNNIEINGRRIEIREEATDKKASLTPWDEEEGVEAGDIVKIQFLVDGKPVSTSDEIWLSNRNRGSRYFSWIDVLTVNEKIAIVQRLTDDDTLLDDRRWKIIWIDEKDNTEEEHISYKTRSDHLLAVEVISSSGTELMQMGFYSDILKGYPSIIFPIFYPIITVLLGILLGITSFMWWLLSRSKQYMANLKLK
jgi:hypothetical protein